MKKIFFLIVSMVLLAQQKSNSQNLLVPAWSLGHII